MANCSINSEQVYQLKKMRTLLSQQTYSKLFLGSIDSMLKGTIGNKLFGPNLGIDQVASISTLKENATKELEAQKKAITDLQGTVKDYKELVNKLTVADIKKLIASKTKRYSSRLDWLNGANNWMTNQMEMIKSCKNQFQQSYRQAEQIATGQDFYNQNEAARKELCSMGLSDAQANVVREKVGALSEDKASAAIRYFLD